MCYKLVSKHCQYKRLSSERNLIGFCTKQLETRARVELGFSPQFHVYDQPTVFRVEETE